MHRPICALILCSAAILAIEGCAGASQEAKSSMPAIVDKATDNSRQYDLNRDGKPDVIEMGKDAVGPDGKKTWKVSRREIDINHDGKIDIVRVLDDEGRLVEETFDLDFDGHIDAHNYYEGGQLARQELDHNFDNKPDTIRYFEKGKLVRKELDQKLTGKMDVFEFYENGELNRIGYDKDGDGKIDVWEQKREAPASQAALGGS